MASRGRLIQKHRRQEIRVHDDTAQKRRTRRRYTLNGGSGTAKNQSPPERHSVRHHPVHNPLSQPSFPSIMSFSGPDARHLFEQQPTYVQ